MAALFRTLGRLAAVLCGVAAVTAINFRLFHVNSPTAAFSYLLLVLALATRVGLKESITASLASMLAYNFFFLPPIRTFTIADPQNWVALFVFLVTAVTASHLSSSARRKAEEASARERELQRMYEFSRALMIGNAGSRLADHITRNISELFPVEGAAFYETESDTVCSLTTTSFQIPEDVLREVTKTGAPWKDVNAGAAVVPVRLGGPCLGSLGIAGHNDISDVALQAIAQLVAIALERERAEEMTARAEAAHQNEQLKSTLLDAFAHEFKTPLTSIKAAATTVLSRKHLGVMERDLMKVVDEEADRLNSLVSDAIELARIGAGPVRLRRELSRVDELISSTIVQLHRLSEGRVLDVKIAPNLAALEIDRRLAELALRQLLTNALQYSPPSSRIGISAEAESEVVVVRVFNGGPGIPKAEQNLIFEKYYRGRDVRERIPGTGMGLAIAREIIEAHGGRLWLSSQPGQGVEFSVTWPVIVPHAHTGARPIETVT